MADRAPGLWSKPPTRKRERGAGFGARANATGESPSVSPGSERRGGQGSRATRSVAAEGENHASSVATHCHAPIGCLGRSVSMPKVYSGCSLPSITIREVLEAMDPFPDKDIEGRVIPLSPGARDPAAVERAPTPSRAAPPRPGGAEVSQLKAVPPERPRRSPCRPILSPRSPRESGAFLGEQRSRSATPEQRRENLLRTRSTTSITESPSATRAESTVRKPRVKGEMEDDGGMEATARRHLDDCRRHMKRYFARMMLQGVVQQELHIVFDDADHERRRRTREECAMLGSVLGATLQQRQSGDAVSVFSDCELLERMAAVTVMGLSGGRAACEKSVFMNEEVHHLLIRECLPRLLTIDRWAGVDQCIVNPWISTLRLYIVKERRFSALDAFYASPRRRAHAIELKRSDLTCYVMHIVTVLSFAHISYIKRCLELVEEDSTVQDFKGELVPALLCMCAPEAVTKRAILEGVSVFCVHQ